MLPPLALADMIAGIYGASATAMALFARQRGDARGQVIDLSLLEPMFSVLGPEAAIYRATGRVKQRVGSASNTSSPRNVYRCADAVMWRCRARRRRWRGGSSKSSVIPR